MNYLEVAEIIEIHDQIMDQSGGLNGIRDMGALLSAIVQPQMVVFGEELYLGLVEKAAVLGFGLISNHPFLDGNKRIGHASMEVFLILNGYEINASVDEQEHIIFSVASGKIDKKIFTDWLQSHVVEINKV